MSQAPFFSVLVPTYNQAQYLGEALDTLICQTDPDWEAVVVDDGSTDATTDVLHAYSARDERIRVIRKENGGTASALNAGLGWAQGRWVCWLSSDDLFDLRKLEVHRAWIDAHPSCGFFYSHFRYLDDATGRVSDPELWRDIPEPQWQVLEMLSSTYIHGNSICVRRDLWTQVGYFDTTLRYGQDYDMWLRLLARGRATFIPERTCVTRVHGLQETNRFPEARFYDSAKAAIRFLNGHVFAELVPGSDLADPQIAREAVSRALEVAARQGGFLYALGTHPALLLRILDWVWSEEAQGLSDMLKPLTLRRLCQMSDRFAGTAFGFQCKVLAAAVRQSGRPIVYHPIASTAVAESRYWQLCGTGRPEANTIRRYLEMAEGWSGEKGEPRPRTGMREVVVVCQDGADVGAAVRYGALQATVETAQYLRRHGQLVCLVGRSHLQVGLIDGLMFLAAGDRGEVADVLSSLGQLDVAIGISRGDVIRQARARQYVIYHHNPSRILGGVPQDVLGRRRVAVLCASEYSRERQIELGVHEDLLLVSPNGYDRDTFGPGCGVQRVDHGLLFAGHVVRYKGLDIALAAFRLIRDRFPDAVFTVYGRTLAWMSNDAVGFPHGWLDADGMLVWTAIEDALPGVKYRGEALPQELADAYRWHSLLVMPSRVDETFGIAAVEAQACGCIPVLPRRGGFPEVMKEGTTGYLYENNTPMGLASTIIELWQSGLPTMLQREQAQGWVRERFSWERTGSVLLDLVESERPRAFPLRQSARVFTHFWRSGARILVRTLRGQPVTRWPSAIVGLWAAYRRTR